LNAVFALPGGPSTIGLCAILGTIIGSYLATLSLRWPIGRGASSGRSACDGCGQALRWFELIPILSYLIARGRCRRCGAPIARLHLAVEIGAAVLGGAAAAAAPTLGGALILSLLFWQLLLLAVLDHRHLWLPDRLTLLLAVSGLALGGHITDVGLLYRATAMVGGFAALEILRRGFQSLRGHEGMGAGDPKIFGAIGAWVGPFALPFILLGSAAFGLGVAAMLLARDRPMTAFPFGAYLAAASVVYGVVTML
jgi:leader peptidase (prepilin peptidase) / N-methyltransferase